MQPDYQAKEPQAEAAGENIAKATQAKTGRRERKYGVGRAFEERFEKVVVMSYRNHEQSDKTEYNASFTVKEKEAEERQVALDSARFYLQLEEAKAKSGGVYVRVEEMPCYPGGEEELMKFLVKKHPLPGGLSRCIVPRHGVLSVCGTGRRSYRCQWNQDVYDPVTDVVSPVRMALARQLEAEAARVVKEMPRWTPGKEMATPWMPSTPCRLSSG